MAVNNESALHFRVQWKFPNMPTERGDYYCYSLSELSRVLYSAEGITRESVEFIYVHQLNKQNNGAMEIIAIDKGNSPNINPHLIYSTVTHPEETKVESTPKVKPALKMLAKPGLVMAGFFYQAYPAEPKEIIK